MGRATPNSDFFWPQVRRRPRDPPSHPRRPPTSPWLGVAIKGVCMVGRRGGGAGGCCFLGGKAWMNPNQFLSIGLLRVAEYCCGGAVLRHGALDGQPPHASTERWNGGGMGKSNLRRFIWKFGALGKLLCVLQFFFGKPAPNLLSAQCPLPQQRPMGGVTRSSIGPSSFQLLQNTQMW